jgi:hypothetical protein
MAEFVDYISMRVNDPTLKSHDGRSQRIDPGHYDFEIDKAVFDQSRSGNRTLRVTGRVLNEGPMIGRSLTCSYVINDTDFARRRMKSLIEATCAPVDEQGGFSRESLIGLRFAAEVVADEISDIDKNTGQPAMRTVTKWIGEHPCDEQPQYTLPASAPAPQAPAPQATAPQPQVGGAPQAAAPATRVTPPRRPAPPPSNGGARR